jgi:hypothetical protein
MFTESTMNIIRVTSEKKPKATKTGRHCSRVGLECTVMYCTVPGDFTVRSRSTSQVRLYVNTDVIISWKFICGPSSGSSRDDFYLQRGGSTRSADRSNDHPTRKQRIMFTCQLFR